MEMIFLIDRITRMKTLVTHESSWCRMVFLFMIPFFVMAVSCGKAGNSTQNAAQGQHDQESPPPPIVAAREAIAEADRAIYRVDFDNEEFQTIIRRKGAGEKLSDTEQERLNQLVTERNESLRLTQQIVSMLKVGNSVFSYPGLLSLAKVSFEEKGDNTQYFYRKKAARQCDTYSMQSVIGYDAFEGGVATIPRHLIIEFDQLGNITALEEFATVKLYNR
jgi:hypothetical protein